MKKSELQVFFITFDFYFHLLNNDIFISTRQIDWFNQKTSIKSRVSISFFHL